VYGDDDLDPSVSENVPADPELERLREAARQHPEGIGTWVALDEEDQ
jgi:hypothetical protein